MTCKRDANTNCCYWMGMPPSDTGRTREESEALESKGITNEINFRMYSATTFIMNKIYSNYIL